MLTLFEDAVDGFLALGGRSEVTQREHHLEVADDRVFVLQVVVQVEPLRREALADHRRPEIATVPAAGFSQQREAQVAGAVGPAPRLGQQGLPLDQRQSTPVEVGARPFAPAVEKRWLSSCACRGAISAAMKASSSSR
jgi:hypothetical protein